MNAHRTHRLLPLPAIFAAAMLVLAACSSADGTAGVQVDDKAHDAGAIATDGGATDSGADAGGASDAYGWGGGASDAGKASGPNTPGAKDQSLGFKPGGAQDIGFFRALIANGQIPKPGDMKIEGWINEHDTKLPKADPKRTVHLHAMAGILEAPDRDPEVVLQLGLNSGKSLDEVDAKVALCVVIDRSGSMKGSKIQHVKDGLLALLDKLPKNTELSIVSFSSGVTTDWKPKVYDPKADKDALKLVINKIVASGGTNMYDGLKVGIAHAKAASKGYDFRRVIILGDGQPSSGNKSHSAIIGLAEDATKDDVSVSSVGVGLNFNPKLMTAIAEQGDGTAWFLQNSAHAKYVFINDLQTMLLPVAEKLWLNFKLAKGWLVDEIYGFDWLQKEDKVTILGPSKPSSAQPQPGADAGSTDGGADAGADAGADKEKPSALPTLFASNKNGMIMVRLFAPPKAELSKVKDLLLSKVEYGYTLSKTGAKEQFTSNVVVPGLVPIPDGGVAYFTGPIVRRSFVLLQVGLALEGAVKLHADGKTPEALIKLAAAKALAAQQVKDVPASYDMAPGIADAISLCDALSVLLEKAAKP